MNRKKKLGIVGGMGARAGALFLQKVIDYSPVTKDQDFLEMILHNNPEIPDRTKGILGNGTSAEKELVRSVVFLTGCGADVITLACITAYYYYDTLSKHTTARIMHPVQILAGYLTSTCPQWRRIGLLASTGAIRSGIFQRSLGSGFEVVTLDERDQEETFMRSLYMPNGLKSGTISEGARVLFAEAVDKLCRKDIDVLVGACSEVSILLQPHALPVPGIDIMDLLAKETVNHCYNLR